MPSRPAISMAEKARYGLAKGSGKRTSTRFALGLLAVGAGGHVAEGERVGQVPRGLGELAGHGAGQAAFLGFEDGAGVMRDQTAQHRFGVLDIAEVAGAVQA